MYECFYAGEDFKFLADVASTWLAYGIGFGCVLWILGRCVAFITQVVKF